jgi:hypothetical protein
MDAVADLLRDDDAPPESGIRLRVPWTPLPGGDEGSFRAAPGPAPTCAPRSDRDVLAEVGEEVFFEVWATVRALTPLQGPWLGRVGAGEIGAAAAILTGLRCGPAPRSATLRARWHELVPGYAAMDTLVGLMVDAMV